VGCDDFPEKLRDVRSKDTVPHCKSGTETVYHIHVVLADGSRKSNRLQIRNLPASTTKDDIQQLVGAFGTVQRCDLGRSDVIIIVFFVASVFLGYLLVCILAIR